MLTRYYKYCSLNDRKIESDRKSDKDKTLEILRDNKIWFSQSNEFNDPFEFDVGLTTK